MPKVAAPKHKKGSKRRDPKKESAELSVVVEQEKKNKTIEEWIEEISVRVNDEIGKQIQALAQEAKKTKRKVALTEIIIPYEEVTRLARIHCTYQEVAYVLGLNYERMISSAAFHEAYKKGWEQGRASLRRLQWDGAEKGHPVMLIWLGKQILGQRDEVRHVTAPEGVPLESLVNQKLTSLSLGELQALKQLIQKAAGKLPQAHIIETLPQPVPRGGE
jgi:hypothetical protein